MQGAGPVCTVGKSLTEVWVQGHHLYVPWKCLEQGQVFEDMNVGRRVMKKPDLGWQQHLEHGERKLTGQVQGEPSMGEGTVSSFLSLQTGSSQLCLCQAPTDPPTVLSTPQSLGMESGCGCSMILQLVLYAHNRAAMPVTLVTSGQCQSQSERLTGQHDIYNFLDQKHHHKSERSHSKMEDTHPNVS